MEPDLFRMNTNQFLQTARTVTFLIQKKKDSIPNFISWYQRAVLQPWQNDIVMSWAKNSRNIIEKEGDLDLNSTLIATLVTSYLTEQDATVKTGRAELLGAGIKKLMRLARKQLPTGISDAASIKIERRWVTASLADWELLHALTYVFTRTHEVCQSLALQLKIEMDPSIDDPSDFERFRDEAQRVQYVKLATMQGHSFSITTKRIHRDDKATLPAELQKIIETSKSHGKEPRSIEDTAEYLAKMAEATFLHFGNHVPMLFLYDQAWAPIDMVSTQFADQADKYLFWRRMADRVQTMRAYGVGWISESWRRDSKNYPRVAIRNLPITGETLHVLVCARNGDVREIVWEIVRSSSADKPTLRRLTDGGGFGAGANYFIPIRRVWGLPDGVIL
jgi:hypothetical protein